MLTRRNLTLAIALLCVQLGLPSRPAEAMVYKPASVGMGDQWLYYHDGVHYLYHLYEQPAGVLHGVYLATSTDGVHFKEVGPVIEKKADASWLGSGSVWRAGDKYIMNFSESRDHQSISFAESTDLIHWQRLGDQYTINPDPRWYENNRWDCIWAMPRDTGGFWGYLSANPKGLPYKSVGMVESSDGVRWNAVAPPVFDWGSTPPMGNMEVAALTKYNNKYYMIAQTWGPYAGGTYMGNTAPGVYTFIGDGPLGPFRPDTGAYRLLGNTNTRSTHFPRFVSTPDGLLVNHFLFTRSMKAWMAPLKKAVFDDQGHLRLGYWKGNDTLKGKPIPVELGPGGESGKLTVDGQASLKTAAFLNVFDVVPGIVLEGTLQIQPSGQTPARCGIYLEETAAQGTAILLGTDGQTQLGTLQLGGTMAFAPDDLVQAGITPGSEHTFRLWTREYMMEFYLDDQLIQCYSIPERATGQIGFVVDGGIGVVGNLKAWNMNFAVPVPEHSSVVLAATGGLALALARAWRKRKRWETIF